MTHFYHRGTLLDGSLPPVCFVGISGSQFTIGAGWVDFNTPSIQWFEFDAAQYKPVASTEPECITFVKNGHSLVRVHIPTRKDVVLFPTPKTREWVGGPQ